MKIPSTLVHASLALGLVAPIPLHAANPPRPNIVVVLADDLGPDGLGCYGSEMFKDNTPAIDRLAAEGIRFTHCYATAICSPSRAQYATGQYPFRNGTLDIDGISDIKNPNRPSITRLLSEAGYTTGKTGKADICRVKPHESLYGLQYWAGGKGSEDSPNAKWQLTGPAPLKEADFPYFPDAQVAFSRDFIERNKPSAANGHKPFYLLVGLNNPHVPIVPTPQSRPDATRDGELYKDNIRFIDHVVESIVTTLQETGQLENTLVIFSADNGSLNTSNGDPIQSRIRDPRTGAYRNIEGAKADRMGNREGTALVPLVVSWPAAIPKDRQGTVAPELVDFSDFLPTFADLADAKIPPNWVIDGRSITPFLLGSPDYKPREWVYFQIENNWCVRTPGHRLNRDGRFFDMSDAPFSSKLLTTLTPEQQAVRDFCQSVLDTLDPINGNTYEAHQDMEWKNPALAWKKHNFAQDFALTSVAGDNSDPDGDGVTNIFERAFGSNPKKNGDTMPKPVSANGHTTVTVPAIRANDVELVALGSADGTTWAPLEPVGTGPFTFTAKGPSDKIKLEAKRITPWKEP